MYSPPTGGAARRPSATIDKKQTSNRRFIICGEKDYLRGYDIVQAVVVIGEYCGGTAKLWRMEPTRPRVATLGKQTARARRLQVVSYRSGSTSSRTRSSHVCRFRIRATLSPRMSASAGRGREL